MQSETREPEKETLGTRSEIEVLPGCRRRLKASVPAEKVRDELDKNYRQLSQNVQLPGFRKGRVPRKLLEARYGGEIEDEVKEALLSGSLAEVVEEKELKVVGSPRFDNVQFGKDADLSYEVELEVRPEFEVAPYDDIEASADAEPVTDEDVEKELKRVCAGRGRLFDVEPSDARPEDLFKGKYQLYRDGVRVKAPAITFLVPAVETVGPFEAPGLKEKWAAWDRSGPLSVDVKVPNDFPDEVLRGADVRLEFELDEVQRLGEPEPSDALAAELGHENLENLRAHVRKDLERRRKRESQEAADEKILKTILEGTPMELPEGLLESQKKRWRLERELHLLEKGVPPDEVKTLLDKEGEEASEDLRRGLKAFFILDKIAEKEKIFATEGEIDARVELMAGYYGHSEGKLREEMARTGRMDELRAMIRHEKVRAFLRKKTRKASAVELSPPGPPEAAEAVGGLTPPAGDPSSRAAAPEVIEAGKEESAAAGQGAE